MGWWLGSASPEIGPGTAWNGTMNVYVWLHVPAPLIRRPSQVCGKVCRRPVGSTMPKRSAKLVSPVRALRTLQVRSASTLSSTVPSSRCTEQLAAVTFVPPPLTGVAVGVEWAAAGVALALKVAEACVMAALVTTGNAGVAARDESAAWRAVGA